MAKYDASALEWLGWAAITPTRASLPPVLCFASKALVCWCSEDSEFAALGIDTGYLILSGGMSWYLSVGEGENIDFTRSITVELLCAHILLECVWYGVVHKLIDKKSTAAMSVDMWCHHLASVFAGFYCKAAGPFLWKVAMQLCTTECTIMLPVAFKQARKANVLKGSRSMVISASMLAAYTWRVVHSSGCVKTFYDTMSARSAAGKVDPYWQLGFVSLATVACCNSYWLFKVGQGVVRHFTKKPSDKKKA